MLPNYIHVGAPKSASTWLWRVCQEHPDIYVPNRKPTSFFILDYERGMEWYEQAYFSEWAGERAVVDMSNSYMVWEPAIKRIARHLPDVRLTMIVREPCERGFLQWAHWEQRGFEPKHKMHFERIFDPGAWTVFGAWLGPGFYAMHLKRIFQHIPRERVKVFLYDDLETDPQKFLSDYFAFLGVDNGFIPVQLNSLIGFPSPEQPLTETSKKGMSNQVKQRLQTLFREDVEELETLIDRDLSHWLL